MSTLQIFQSNDFNIAAQLDKNGEPLFRADEICASLNYSNPRDALSRHVDEDDLVKREVIDSLGRTQQANFVNESGLYALIFGSKLPKAKEFKRWVTSEVLPNIRKTGGYQLASTPSHAQIRESSIVLQEMRKLEQILGNMERHLASETAWKESMTEPLKAVAEFGQQQMDKSLAHRIKLHTEAGRSYSDAVILATHGAAETIERNEAENRKRLREEIEREIREEGAVPFDQPARSRLVRELPYVVRDTFVFIPCPEESAEENCRLLRQSAKNLIPEYTFSARVTEGGIEVKAGTRR